MRTAAVLAFALLIAACGSPPPAASGSNSSPGTAPEGGWLQQSLGPATPTPSPGEPSPQVAPTPSPAPAAAATPAPSCYPLKGGAGSRATITDVRVGTHPGYDRVVVEFSGGPPHFQIVAQDPSSFVAPGSGNHVDVAGSAAVHLTVTEMDVPPAYPHGTNLKPRYSELKNVVVLGVYEGQADLAIGLNSLSCPTVGLFNAPSRLVIDFPTG